MLSRSTGTWFVGISRALRGADGRLEADVVAALAPHFFAQLWRGVDIGTQGSIGVFSQAGNLLVRSPAVDGLLGQSFADAPLLQQPSGIARVARLTSSIDGVERLYARRPVSDYPQLVLVVGKSIDELLAPWVRFSVMALGGWLLATSLLALLGALRDSESRRQFALDAAAIGEQEFQTPSDGPRKGKRLEKAPGRVCRGLKYASLGGFSAESRRLGVWASGRLEAAGLEGL